MIRQVHIFTRRVTGSPQVENFGKFFVDRRVVNNSDIIDQPCQTLNCVGPSREANQDDFIPFLDICGAHMTIGFADLSCDSYPDGLV